MRSGITPTLYPPRGGEGAGNSRTAGALVLLLVVLFALPLAGCGKKGQPVPPADEPNVYPRSYPSE